MATATLARPAALSWELLAGSPVASSRTDDIWFFDAMTGWLVNSSGYVCKTEDGGSSWIPKFFLYPNLPSRPYLRCISWATRKIGWIGAVTGIDADTIFAPSQYIRNPPAPHHRRRRDLESGFELARGLARGDLRSPRRQRAGRLRLGDERSRSPRSVDRQDDRQRSELGIDRHEKVRFQFNRHLLL